jgi:predicted TIM-barrel fold metal-dependent hydrolase
VQPAPEITDGQVHIWGAHSPERPWPSERLHDAHRPVALSADDLLAEMQAAGVSRAVLVPPSWEGDRNDLVLEAVRRHPDRFRAMGRVDPLSPETIAAVPRWRDSGLSGHRFVFIRDQEISALRSGALDPYWRAVEQHSLPIMAYFPGLADVAADVATRFPGLRLVFDHLGLPPTMRIDESRSLIDAAISLARFPNVSVKVSALPCHAIDSYPFPSVLDVVRRVVDAFGPERVMWGSDLTRIPCTYRESVGMIADGLSDLGPDAVGNILGRSVENWLGWKVTREPGEGSELPW